MTALKLAHQTSGMPCCPAGELFAFQQNNIRYSQFGQVIRTEQPWMPPPIMTTCACLGTGFCISSGFF